MQMTVEPPPAVAPKLIELKTATSRLPAGSLLIPLLGPLERTLGLDALNDVYARFIARLPRKAGDDPAGVFQAALDALEAEYSVASADLAKIPRTGPLMVVANHPFGGVEGVLLGHLLTTVRPDVKILGNSLLSRIAGLCDHIIPVNPFGTPEAVGQNIRGMKEALRWLKKGGVLAAFPAGEVASFRLRQRQVLDPPWSPHLASLAQRARSAVLPVYFPGHNGLPFHLLGLVHPRLRTAMLPRELVNKRRTAFRMYIGRAIGAPKCLRFETAAALTDHLRISTYFLKHRDRQPLWMPLRVGAQGWRASRLRPVIAPLTPADLQKEIDRLPSTQRLVGHGDLAVYVAEAPQIPRLLREIGRLREITFRAANEGTAKALDLDRFDAYYHHLFLWNHESRELVGAYRMGLTDRILSRYGLKGLYTSHLFRYRRNFKARIGMAIEFGRSFIRPEYQRQFNSLSLLWKGIGQVIARNPQYRVLFGAVSISRDYHRVSKNLMVRFLKDNNTDPSLARSVAARKTYRARRIQGIDNRLLRTCLQDIEDVSLLVSDIEHDGKGVPILLRQYLKLNGSLLCFNVDRSFADVVDGLFLVDLNKTDPRLLKRFMGPEGFHRFSALHSPLPPPAAVDRQSHAA